MSYASIFQSIVSEKRWVSTINKTLSKQIAIDIPPPPTCIFRVPKTLVDEKPEAYIPKVIGLGPFHHLRPEMHRMLRYKIAAAIRILTQDQQDRNVQQIVVDRLKDIEPYIRACYDEYLDIDDETLSSMLAIDGLYLLARIGYDQNATSDVASSSKDNAAESIDEIKDDNTTDAMFFQSQHPKDQEEIEIKPAEDQIETTVNTISWSSVAKIPDEVMKTPRDIMMLENQIPLIVLKEIVKAIHVYQKTQPKSLDELLQAYCEQHSPLKLLPNVRFRDDTGPAHLLDFMYNLVVCNIKPKQSRHQHSPRPRGEPTKFEGFTTFLNNMVQAISIACSDNLPKPFLLMKKLFLFVVPMIKKESEGGDTKANVVEEIHVPSVSQLIAVAQVMFKLTPGGIRDIKFDEETLYFYLPAITLKVNSEIILRNMTAYEQAITHSGTILELTEYVDLMCAIIDTAKDVEVLRKEGIIVGDLSDDAIVKLFNGIKKHDSHSCDRSELRKAIFKVRKRFHGRPVVKAYVIVKKTALIWWKAIVMISTVVVVLLVIYQQVCSVYKCNPHIFGTSLQRPMMISKLYESM